MDKKIKNDCKAAELKNQVDDNTKMMVLSMLTDKPQERHILASAIGITERTFRHAVRELRREGNHIIAVSRGKGYKLGTREEALANARELMARLIDAVVWSCKEQGIETLTPTELEEMKQKWGAG